MKFLPFLSIVLFGLMISVSACGGESDAKAQAREAIKVAPAPAANANQTTTVGTNPQTPPAKAEPAQNAKGVWHFTCAKGCAGGGGSAAETCKGCSGPLTHNAVYHEQ